MTNQVPSRTEVRAKAFDVIDGEREYQDKNHPILATLVDETNLLIEFTDKLAVAVTMQHPSPHSHPCEILREIASIATRAMEHFGIHPRENHVPASAGITGVANIVAKPDSVKPAPKAAPPAPAAAAPAPHPVPPHLAESAPHAEHTEPKPVAEHTTQHGGEHK